MRHSAITLTLDTYGHLFPEQQADAVTKLQHLLGAGEPESADSLRATGTDMATPADGQIAQRLAQRGGRDSERGHASRCEETDGEQSEGDSAEPSCKVIPIKALRDGLQIDANPCKSSRSGTRTRTGVTSHRILSPVRLPFRHPA